MKSVKKFLEIIKYENSFYMTIVLYDNYMTIVLYENTDYIF